MTSRTTKFSMRRGRGKETRFTNQLSTFPKENNNPSARNGIRSIVDSFTVHFISSYEGTLLSTLIVRAVLSVCQLFLCHSIALEKPYILFFEYVKVE